MYEGNALGQRAALQQAQYDGPSAATQPSPTGAIAREIDATRELAYMVNAHAEELQKRLSPVLLAVPEATANKTSAIQPGGTDMQMSVRTIAETLRRTHDTLDAIHRSLAL